MSTRVKMSIPVNEPLFDDREKELLIQCIETGWISSDGPFVSQFEEQFSAYVGRSHGVAVANGTAALEVAIDAIELEPGDEVIMPTFTIISCPLAVVRRGGVPVLIDSEPRTWTMDVDQIESRITPRTKAIMPVHIYGHPVDMDPLMDLANRYGLAVVEDAAEAHGAEYNGRKAGSFGDVSCFSFYANKIITTGEGGMLLTDDPHLAERSRSLRNLCFDSGRRFYHEELGHNFRMTNLQAAVGIAQLEKIDEFIDKKRRMAGFYNRELAGIPGLQLPAENEGVKNVYWMYGLVLDEKHGTAADLAAELGEHGIATRPFFLGMHEQPVFEKRGLFAGEEYPVAQRLAVQGLYLPSGMALTEDQLAYVGQGVREVMAS